MSDKVLEGSDVVLSPIAEDICKKRYYQKDENGQIKENWHLLTKRVVDFVCSNEPEEIKKQIFDLILGTYFVPNSPCLVNAGGKSKSAGIMACFVTKDPDDCWSSAGVPDSVGMVENIANFGHIARCGGGCGFNVSKIRPEGDFVFGSTHAKACGPIEHMRMISEVMSSITQSGFRAMAMMAVMNINHPDIFKFIQCKQSEKALKSLLKDDFFNQYDLISKNISNQLKVILDKFLHNFNLSVFVSDDFMNKVKNDKDFNLEFNGKVYKTIKARELFNTIAENAWKNGDPGFLFGDTINNTSPYRFSGQKISATNPCGEICSPEISSCNLSSIDLSKYYDERTNNLKWEELKKCIHLTMRFLDDVIDVNKYPTIEFHENALKNRPVGLGMMGFADLLLQMKVAYGSDESIKIAEEIGHFFQFEAHQASVVLAKERGTPEACNYKELEYRRNVTTLSIAPTGTISQLANCSSGIEPIYSLTVVRQDNTGRRVVSHPDIDKEYFRCAIDPEKTREVSFEQHIKIQAAFQKYVDASISKTINLPNDATIDTVKKAYMLAYESGCKGITIYRDGSKSFQVLNTSEKEAEKGITIVNAPKRPRSVQADIFKIKAIGRDWYVIIGKVNKMPYEVFAVGISTTLPDKGMVIKRKSGHYSLLDEGNKVLIENLSDEERAIDASIELETRRFSLMLRHGIHPKFIVQQINRSNDVISSFSNAVKRIFATKYLNIDDKAYISKGVYCPECAENGKMTQMIADSTCWICPECNYSKCG